MQKASSISQLPSKPCVYAMHGGRGRYSYIAYVGIARSLRKRILQHLAKRDDGLTSGGSAVGLNVEHVTRVSWWQHPDFATHHVLEATELVAFDVLKPSLRGTGRVTEPAKEVYASDSFRKKMKKLLSGRPAGQLQIVTLEDALEKRVGALEKKPKS